MYSTLKTFIGYAKKDKDIKRRLLDHLNPLKKAFNLTIWDDDCIEPGQEWKPLIEEQLNQTELFLFLVSVDFMNSDFINQVEFKIALERHRKKQAIVIPIIIKHCQWDIDMEFDGHQFNLNELQVLPYEAKPIDEWKSQDQAFNNIAGGIRKLLQSIKDSKIKGPEIEKKDHKPFQIVTDNHNLKKHSTQNLLLKAVEQTDENDEEIRRIQRSIEQKIDDENYLWQQISKDRTLGAYKHYLQKYPSGKFAQEAKASVIKFEEKISQEKESMRKRMRVWKESEKENAETKSGRISKSSPSEIFFFVGIIAIVLTLVVLIVLGIIDMIRQ